MSEELGRRMREAPLPGAPGARERARATVLAAHAATPPRRRRLRPTALAVALAILAGAATAPGQAVAKWLGVDGPARAVQRLVHEVVEPAATPRPVRSRVLPAPGRLLVTGARGAWIVDRDGTRHDLGRGADGTWSPQGLYVALATGHTLVAADPAGRIAWRLHQPARVTAPRWAPDGTHVAYRAGGGLRVVFGNGIGDHLVARATRPVAPAWRPGDPHTLAWAGADGRVRVADAGTGRILRRWRAGAVTQLSWSADGRRLLVAGERGGRIHDMASSRSTRLRIPRGTRLEAAAFAPRGDRLALATWLASGRGEVRVVGAARPVIVAPGRLSDLTWSPDGRWLLARWPAGAQWLFSRATGRGRVEAHAAFARSYGARARPQGWIAVRAVGSRAWSFSPTSP